MKGRKTKGACSIVTENGMNILIMPNGDRIPRQYWSRVHDECDCIPTAIIKLEVNLFSTIDEAIKFNNEE